MSPQQNPKNYYEKLQLGREIKIKQRISTSLLFAILMSITINYKGTIMRHSYTYIYLVVVVNS